MNHFNFKLIKILQIYIYIDFLSIILYFFQVGTFQILTK